MFIKLKRRFTMKNIILTLISLFSVLTFSLSANAIKVGALYLDTQGFFGEIKVGIESAGEVAGIELTGANSEGDVAKESEFIDILIAKGVDVVVMSPVSTEASVAAVERLSEAGIPVVCYNTCLTDADAERLVYALVTTSQRTLGFPVGVLAGEWAIKAEIDLKIGIHNCNQYEACQEREDGFIDGLKSTGVNFEVVNNQEAFTNDKATQIGTDMLIANPEINLMYAANEGGTIGAVNAVVAAGQQGSTFVMGTDTTEELLNMLLDGEILLAVNSQFPRDMGAGAMKAALKAIKGEKIDQYVQLTPTKLYTPLDRVAVAKWLSEH
jgi:ABC-type sugar transport system substrate-binding protein